MRCMDETMHGKRNISIVLFWIRGGGLALALVLINTNSTGAMFRENKMKQKCWNKKDAQGASA